MVQRVVDLECDIMISCIENLFAIFAYLPPASSVTVGKALGLRASVFLTVHELHLGNMLVERVQQKA